MCPEASMSAERFDVTRSVFGEGSDEEATSVSVKPDSSHPERMRNPDIRRIAGIGERLMVGMMM
jgi:hypothetical protein